jgi:hypothetical protein
VGFKGYPHNTSQHTEFLINDSYQTHLGLILDTQLDVQAPLLLRGVEWVHSWLESAIAYSSTILYESNLISTDISNLEHVI